jgi:hypothetical protein
MNNILLITNKISSAPKGGREMLCKLTFDILKNIYKDNFFTIQLNTNSITNYKDIVNAFKGHIDGVNDDSINETLRLIKAKNIAKVFIDGSNLGAMCKIIKKKYPKIIIFTFFHNVESRFFLGALKESKTLRALAVFIINYLAEKKSVKWSDRLLCINKRDSALLNKVYGRASTDLYPMSLEDKLTLDPTEYTPQTDDRYILFVGGTFYANVLGISWFVKNVVPNINMKLYIVGKGFEKLKSKLEIDGKVQVIGAVESLEEWYVNSHFVIAPIFDGSGMKTKVAEALMYGKRIIGTPEAFTGYEDIVERVGVICHNSDEFIAEIASYNATGAPFFDTELRAIYENNYSFEAAKLRLQSITNHKT